MKIKVLSFFFVASFFPMAASGEIFKIATISPDGLGWMSKLREGIEQIQVQTEERVIFKIYPGGVQGDDATVLRKMRNRHLNGGDFASGSRTRFLTDPVSYTHKTLPTNTDV